MASVGKLIVIGAGVGVLAALATSGGSSYTPTPGGGWADRDAPRRIHEYAATIEEQTGWYGLGDFLTAVAWGESRGNSQAVNKQEAGEPNVARGWFQIRPKSALVEGNPQVLFDEPTAVALAADYAYRLKKYSDGNPDWLALRRGWAYPSLVDDVDEDKERSQKVRERFEEALAASGIPERFMYKDAFPSGFVWPGRENVLRMVGGSPNA